MKVLFNASMYMKKPTGVGVFIREIYNLLTTTYISEKENDIYTYSDEGLPTSSSVKKIKLPFYIDAIARKSLSFHRTIWNRYVLPIKARKYTLVYSFSSHGSPFLKNQVITVHDLIALAYPKQYRMQYLYFKYVLPPILKSAKRIVTVSAFTKSEVVKYYGINPEKITVINHAADHIKPVDTFNVPPKEEKIKQWLDGQQFFLTVGAFRAHKNVERLMDAVESLKGNQILIVVGAPNAYFNGLKKICAEKEDTRIHFFSYVSHELLGYLYKNCIANVYISLYEGMGLPPYEAAVYNTVTIASNVTAIPEIYGDAVYYVNPANTEQIRNALELFSNDKIDKNQYRSKFPALLDKYKWKHTAAKIAAVIEKETETML